MPDKKQTWAFPGLHYFEDDEFDRKLFFGRERETRELTEKIIAESITVLFGKSGDGKTSLINASLKPALRQAGYLPVRARIFATTHSISPIQALYQAMQDEAAHNNMPLPENWQKQTLWETFFALRPDEKNRLKPIVLILDQFEELFTLMASGKAQQEEFIRQFADLVRGRLPGSVREHYRGKLGKMAAGSAEARAIEKLLFGQAAPTVRILISLREDYLAFLDNLGKRIPKVYQSRYRLTSLTIEQAREAIARPPQQDVLGNNTFQIEKDAVDALLEFLTVQSSQSGVSHQIVGPPQLQVLCRQLEAQMWQEKRRTITVNDLGGEKGMRKLLSRYYRGITKRFSLLKPGSGPRKQAGFFGLLRRLQPAHSPRLAVRRLCEDRLITAGGNRNSRHQDEIVREIGVSEANLQQLVDSRLLRREPRLQESFYELSHDSLVQSLQAAGGLRQGWIMSLRFAFFAALALAFFLWGWPFIRDTVTVRNLKADLEAVRNGEITPEEFRFQFSRAERILADWDRIAAVSNAFDAWRLDGLEMAILEAEQLVTADSLLNLLKVEYAWDELRINSMEDSLRQRKFWAVERQYETFVEAAKPDYRRAKSFLDSASVVLGKSVRIDTLLADIETRLGNIVQAQQIQASIARDRSATAQQLQEAIKIKIPKGSRVTRYVGEAATKVRIVLENDERLRGARIRLGRQEMQLIQIGKQRFREGYTQISQGATSARLNFSITGKDGTQAQTTRSIEIDRKPPLRSEAVQKLTENQVVEMIKKYDYYQNDIYRAKEWSNQKGKGIANDFEAKSTRTGDVIIDHATGLMWQKDGSSDYMTYGKALEYIADLNRKRFAGFDNWRLPTLEEAMSLIEPQRQGKLYIDSKFEQTQGWIWTADIYYTFTWVVSFSAGGCNHGDLADYGRSFVRAVRRGQ